MGLYVAIPAEKDVLDTEAAISDIYVGAEAAHREYTSKRAEYDNPASKVSRGLTPSERFQEGQKLRSEAAEKAEALGDLNAERKKLGRFAAALDIKALARAAMFRPLLQGPMDDSTAHDQRVMAEEVVRRRYTEELSLFRPEDVVAEIERIVDDVGDAPHTSSGLAKLREIDRFVASKSGPEWSRAKSRTISAYRTIEDNWPARTALVESVERAARKADLGAGYRQAIRTGIEPPHIAMAKAMAKSMVKQGA